MSTKQKKKTEDEFIDVEFNDAPPEGYEKAGARVDRFWDPEKSTVHGKLLERRVFTSKLDDGKLSSLLVFELVSPCAVKDGDGKSGRAEPGEVIGVWTTSAMNVLVNAGGSKVWMKRLEKEQLGGGRSRWNFDIRFAKGGEKLRTTRLGRAAENEPDEEFIPF